MLRRQISGVGHNALISVLDAVFAFFQLDHGATNSVEQIERLKACDDDGNLELVGNRWIFPIAHYAANVSGCEKCLHLVLRRTHDGFDRGRDKDVGDKHREVLEAAPLGNVNAHSVGGSRGFKTHAEEDDLLRLDS